MEKSIRNFIKENFMYEDELKIDQSLLETGVMNSMGAVELVLFLEEEFDIVIEDDEITPENLDSLDNIMKFLGNK